MSLESRSVQLTLAQDAALSGAPTAGRGSSVLTHLPGSSLRGALAAQWIQRHSAPLASNVRRERFLRLFEQEVTFGPAFVGDPPLPLSVHRHKATTSDGCPRSSVDAAVEDVPAACSHCGSPFVASKGELPEPVPTKRRTHVAIGSDGTALEGKLFSRTVLDHQQGLVLSGEVRGPAELLDDLAELQRVRIGGRRSTHGAADVSWQPIGRDDEPVVSRTAAGDVVLRLTAPAVLVDELGRARREPLETELSRLLSAPAVVRRSWIRWSEIGGWHAASGLPKPVDRGVAAGSVFLIATDAAADRVADLVRQGLGLRRVEGLGALARRPPFDADAVRRRGLVAQEPQNLPSPHGGKRPSADEAG